MFFQERLIWGLVSIFVAMIPAQSCNAAMDWASYVFSGEFEGGDYIDVTENASDGTLGLVGVDPLIFVPVTEVLVFNVDGAVLAADLGSVRVFRNGVEVPVGNVNVSPQSIVLNNVLQSGRNHLVVLATDAEGYALSSEVYLWAGDNSITVTAQDESGMPVSSAVITLELADDTKISKTIPAAGGVATFANVPATTITLTAKGGGNSLGVLSTTGNVSSATVILKGFQQASGIDNNDFSLGLQGWEVGSAPVSLISHQEEGGGTPRPGNSLGRASMVQYWDVEDRRHGFLQQPSFDYFNKVMEVGEDMDLILITSGIGAQSVSRTFEIAPGTSRIKVRYRFITTEIPGGYFGSRYNDNYSISIRTLGSGATKIVSNSMNGLGRAAFDSNGATAWHVVTLPVDGNLHQMRGGPEVVQIDAMVTNIGDGDYNSAIVIDYVEQEPLSISVDLNIACPNQAVTFQVDGNPSGIVTWTGGGQPATGTGLQFTTRFANAGQVNVQAQHNYGGRVDKANATVTIWETSGPAWVMRFPTSVLTADLVEGFRNDVDAFIAALRAGNATVNIAATLRPPERAYLMHYSYRISQEGIAPSAAPGREGVDICWEHRDADGNVDLAASAGAARAMENAYGIRFRPALQSRHTQGRAIDMNINWAGNLTIQTAGGGQQTITTLPRTGAGNVELHAVGAGYGVIKLVADPPHWSDDGR